MELGGRSLRGPQWDPRAGAGPCPGCPSARRPRPLAPACPEPSLEPGGPQAGIEPPAFPARGRITFPREHGEADAGVAELHEGLGSLLQPLAGQQDVLGADVAVNQVFILLWKTKGREIAGGTGGDPAAGCGAPDPRVTPRFLVFSRDLRFEGRAWGSLAAG